MITRSILLLSIIILFLFLVGLVYTIKFFYKRCTETEDYNSEDEDSSEEDEEEDVKETAV